ncbi:hypothetical protein SAMN05443377_1424 [Propionibacterium cyclohexanicum]|uniref:Uncharacterized protein n=1 Tax=Propionibacterium cyclohexanicum TaxID=64702 RepID=A0A1H9U5R6_9ACTN|nr:hypothetical protein SAMN05443377_1424 [Propionibacterium cyclohexanicum]
MVRAVGGVGAGEVVLAVQKRERRRKQRPSILNFSQGIFMIIAVDPIASACGPFGARQLRKEVASARQESTP